MGGIIMTPFNLDEYLKNPSQKIVTRDDREVEIIDTAASGEYPVVASIESTFFKDKISYRCTKDGKCYKGILSELDLFFALEEATMS